MTIAAIHRLVEQQAALRGDVPALLEGDRSRSYRHLNYTANALARRLLTSGFRRGSHATVSMPLGIDLAVVLLAILKAGGSYTWSAPGTSTSFPSGLSFPTGTGGEEARYLHLDIGDALADRVTACPNLPIVTRGSDVACILQEADGAPMVMVPHATIASLRPRALTQQTPWMGDAGAFDLWIALMAGTTAVVETHRAAAAA